MKKDDKLMIIMFGPMTFFFVVMLISVLIQIIEIMYVIFVLVIIWGISIIIHIKFIYNKVIKNETIKIGKHEINTKIIKSDDNNYNVFIKDKIGHKTLFFDKSGINELYDSLKQELDK